MPDINKLTKAKIPCEGNGIEVKRTLCDICCPGMHCGVDAYVKDGKIIKLEGTKEHPRNHGLLCTKGAAGRQYVYREDRIKTPLRRIGERGEGKFEPITWEKAYRIVADELLKVKKEYGADSVAFFSGYTKWYRQYLHRFAYSFGSINYGTECSTCFKASEMAWEATVGLNSDPDMENSNVILGFALNGFHSRYLVAPRLLRLKEQGKKFIIIDPRKTPATQKLADIHLQIKPGTDGALALGMANLIIENDWHDKEYIEKYTYGFEEYAKYVKQFTLERTAEITGLRKEDIYEATKMYATNGPASITETSCSLTHHINGFQNYRAMICLNGLTGNFDRPGGQIPEKSTFYDMPAGFDMYEHEYYLDVQPDRKSKAIGCTKYPLWCKFMDEFQAMDMSRQILEGTPYPIKALYGAGMNAKMFPDTKKMYEALKALDFFVDVDLFMTDTAKYADIVLPACTSYERGEFKAYIGGYATFTKPVIEPLYESKSDVQILKELADVMELDDKLLREGYEAEINYMIRDLSITIEDMKASDLPIKVPEARDVVPGEFTTNGMNTASGKFEFYSNYIAEFKEQGLSPIPTYRPTLDDEGMDEKEYPYILVTGSRIPNAIHSRLHNVPWTRSLRPDPMVDINAEDAKELGVEKGDLVEIETITGKIRVKVNPSVKIRKGDVQMFHGYGEANANDLIGSTHTDPYSGYPGFKSSRCKLTPVRAQEA
ncbi:molybdopterin-dependent oxidoreductase [Faecalicatena acetigenes]|uniref:Molybdopterin-dependent oxidoreductase n=1 Tax=Faecalicatena acetigenes TaxID=2981790 RepID=A0ABT2TCC7_9FIRM|nr:MULTISPECIES: molybdopterin-dependent oxidoreductase [Lachnospiraceae]MCU6747933.1 molybdopterin-dependent oxidoreductase [Faecalicatena acetigenes]SCI17530.1 Sulfur reductase chain A [uncultured Clostridium sp.]